MAALATLALATALAAAAPPESRVAVPAPDALAERSPAVVAASALAGYMAPPSELGIEWDPEKFV